MFHNHIWFERTTNSWAAIHSIDLHDAFTAKYRIKVKGKKWWWLLFTNMIDTAIVNSWQLHRLTHDDRQDLLHFRRLIATTLLKTTNLPLGNETTPLQNARKGCNVVSANHRRPMHAARAKLEFIWSVSTDNIVASIFKILCNFENSNIYNTKC